MSRAVVISRKREPSPFATWSLAMHRFLWASHPPPNPGPPADAPADAHAAQALAMQFWKDGVPVTEEVRAEIEPLWTRASRQRREAEARDARVGRLDDGDEQRGLRRPAQRKAHPPGRRSGAPPAPPPAAPTGVAPRSLAGAGPGGSGAAGSRPFSETPFWADPDR
jgi:hypothetical protein